jgi:hypothetical protein
LIDPNRKTATDVDAGCSGPGPEVVRPPSPRDELPPVDQQIAQPVPGPPGQPVVQINVEEDMLIDGGSEPVREGATDYYGRSRRKTIGLIVAAILAVVLLALPVIWGLVETVSLAATLGPWIVVWLVLLVALAVAAAVFGYRLVQTGL